MNSTDSSNLLGGIEVNSTTPPQSQQMHHRPVMFPLVTHPHTTMHSTRPIPPIHPMHSTGLGYPRYGGGGGQYGTMPGQYVNQIQMARPGGMEMNMAQPALPHVISSYNPATGAGVRPFSKLGAAVPQQRSPPMYPPTLRQQGQLCVSIIL